MANAELVAKIKKYINEKHKHLDIFTEQQLIDYLLGKAKGNEKNFKLDNFNIFNVIFALFVPLKEKNAPFFSINSTRKLKEPATKFLLSYLI